MRLADYEEGKMDRGGRKSLMEDLPGDVLEQIREVRAAGTHSTRGIVKWLHDPDIHGDQYKHITVSMVGAWLRRQM